MGEPVSLTTGAVFFTHTDAIVGDLVFSRTYNSRRTNWTGYSNTYGAFGPGWNASVEVRLEYHTAAEIAVRNADGNPQYYRDSSGTGVLNAVIPRSAESQITQITCPPGLPPNPSVGCYQRSFRAGGSETFWGPTPQETGLAKLVSVTDAAGVVTTYTYEVVSQVLGRLLSVSRLNRSIAIEYSGGSTYPWRLHAGDLSGPVLATYTYTGQFLSTVTYADGSGYQYFPDTSQPPLMASVLDWENKKIEAHTYDSSGRAWTSEIGDGVEKLTFVYGTPQLVTVDPGNGYQYSYTTQTNTVTDALGNVTTHSTSTAGGGVARVTQTTGSCSGCGQSTVGTWTYDDAGNITSYTDGSNHTWTYTYDPATGDLLTETTPPPESAQTLYHYYPDGRVQTIQRPDTGVTSYTYGPAGPLTITESVTATQNRTTTLTYSPQGACKTPPTPPPGKLCTIQDPRSKTTTLGYDSFGDLTTVTNPRSKVWTFGYDALGRRTSVKDPLNPPTTTVYGDGVHITSIINPDSTHTDFTYDKAGRRKTVTDPLGRLTEYGYDPYGRLQTVKTKPTATDPPSSVTTYDYDLMSNLKFITDARGKVTTFDYDEFNRVKKVTYPPGPPGGPFESFTYDGAGHLWTRTDRKGVVTTYGYDNTGRLSGKTYSDGSPAVTFTYDSVGRLKTGANDADSLTLTYDLAGQLQTEASVANNSTITYTYDLAGNRQGVLINGVVYLWSVYDDAERLWYTSSQASPSQPWKTSYFGYDDANRRTALLYPNLMEAFYGYDTLSRLTAVLHYDVTTTPATLRTYASYNPYDAAGNRTIRAIPSYSDSYGYDSLYRLTSVTRSGTLTEQYTYDSVGNRLSALGDPTWTYGDRNELQSHSGTTFVYDPSGNGNLISRADSSGNWAFEWTVENLLKRVTKNGTEVARFTYDPLGRRISRTVGATVYKYLYDGQDILQATAGATTYRFVHGPGVDEHLAAEVPGGASSYYHADGLGSMVLLTNSNRASIWGYLYDGFGQIQGGGAIGGYTFTGREWDPETGLYYYRARYYDPKIGRFLSEDPIGFKGGGNFYAYVNDNPVNWTDPSGLLVGPDPYTEGFVAYVWVLGQAWKLGNVIADKLYPPPKTCETKRERDCWKAYVDCVKQAQKKGKSPDLCSAALKVCLDHPEIPVIWPTFTGL